MPCERVRYSDNVRYSDTKEARGLDPLGFFVGIKARDP